MSSRHKLLQRQLRKAFGDELPESGSWRELLDQVDATYEQVDSEHALLEHSMDTVSEELGERYQRLQDVLAESRVKEVELAGTLSLLRSIVDSTEDGVLVVDLDGHIVLSNRRFAEIWSIPESIMLQGEDGVALVYVLEQIENPAEFVAKVEALYADREAESFDVIRFKDGRLLERLSIPHRLGDEIVGRVWSFRDVSKRSRLEEQLRQSQKMEAIGHLAGGVAHDFNNLLTVVFGHSEILERQLADRPKLRDSARKILEAAERAARLTRQLLAFGRRQLLQPEIVDLNAVLRNLESMLRSLIRENIRIRFDLEPGVGQVFVDRGQLEQMILNLAVNARDAMPMGGELVFTTERIDASLDSTWAAPAGATGSWIVLEVADSGAGIPEEHRARIFEPFFTTKPAGQGTGLGLAMVYGFLEQSGGKITVRSAVGTGSSFRVYLPSEERAESEAARAPESAARGSETILVVEDEAVLREIVSRALELRGYRVFAAASGEEAVRRAERLEERIDLLLTDVVMPGIGGGALAEAIRALHPETKVLFTSGYTRDEVVRQGVGAATAHFLEKPFTHDVLASAVRRALDAARDPGGATPAPAP